MKAMAAKQPSQDFHRQHQEVIQAPALQNEIPSADSIVLQRMSACPCGGGCPLCEEDMFIQPKLRIGEPGDRYEREADRAADEVVGIINASHRQTVPPWEFHEKHEAQTQRKVNMRQKPNLSNRQSNRVIGGTNTQLNVYQSEGKPLKESTRVSLEPCFGYNLSHVRIHTDSQAAETVGTLNAEALTIGQDILFATGRYAPESTVGTRLLVHELTHVIQQTAGAVSNDQFVSLSHNPIISRISLQDGAFLIQGSWRDHATEAAETLEWIPYILTSRWLWNPINNGLESWEQQLEHTGNLPLTVIETTLLVVVSLLFNILRTLLGIFDLASLIHPASYFSILAAQIRVAVSENPLTEILAIARTIGNIAYHIIIGGIIEGIQHFIQGVREGNAHRITDGLYEIALGIIALIGIFAALRAAWAGRAAESSAAVETRAAVEARPPVRTPRTEAPSAPRNVPEEGRVPRAAEERSLSSQTSQEAATASEATGAEAQVGAGPAESGVSTRGRGTTRRAAAEERPDRPRPPTTRPPVLGGEGDEIVTLHRYVERGTRPNSVRMNSDWTDFYTNSMDEASRMTGSTYPHNYRLTIRININVFNRYFRRQGIRTRGNQIAVHLRNNESILGQYLDIIRMEAP